MLLGMTAVGLLGPALARASGLSEAHALVAAMGLGMALATWAAPTARPAQKVTGCPLSKDRAAASARR